MEVAGKPGSKAYGTTNDVGVAWKACGTPIVLAVLPTKPVEHAAWDDMLVADTARVVVRAFGG